MRRCQAGDNPASESRTYEGPNHNLTKDVVRMGLLMHAKQEQTIAAID